MSKGCRCGALLKNQVELIDFGFEGGMRVDEVEQLGVFMLRVRDTAIEEYVTRHLSYTIIINPNLSNLFVSCNDGLI